MSGARRGAGRRDPRVDATHGITNAVRVFSGDAGAAAQGAATMAVFAIKRNARQQSQLLAREAASAGGPADRGAGDARARAPAADGAAPAPGRGGGRAARGRMPMGAPPLAPRAGGARGFGRGPPAAAAGVSLPAAGGRIPPPQPRVPAGSPGAGRDGPGAGAAAAPPPHAAAAGRGSIQEVGHAANAEANAAAAAAFLLATTADHYNLTAGLPAPHAVSDGDDDDMSGSDESVAVVVERLREINALQYTNLTNIMAQRDAAHAAQIAALLEQLAAAALVAVAAAPPPPQLAIAPVPAGAAGGELPADPEQAFLGDAPVQHPPQQVPPADAELFAPMVLAAPEPQQGAPLLDAAAEPPAAAGRSADGEPQQQRLSRVRRRAQDGDAGAAASAALAAVATDAAAGVAAGVA